ncbi:hypothetical protein ASZ90_011059 [hydrocarbon metagenome]|uniref:Uncharacterized protein n=1 Tax=hydrocarbon metagenome TaxID=938273 RepID=A0A0W8FEC2_9ZZZZ
MRHVKIPGGATTAVQISDEGDLYTGSLYECLAMTIPL